VIGSSFQYFEILGIKINRLSKVQVATWWNSVIQSNRKVSICIANAHTLNLACRDIDYLKCLENFYVLNDGVGVSMASKILYGEDFHDNLNGTDLIPYYLGNTSEIR
jgi:alpha-1,3-mannosyltransferase